MKLLKLFYLLIAIHTISINLIYSQCGAPQDPCCIDPCLDQDEEYSDFELVSGGKISDLEGNCLLSPNNAKTTAQKIILLGKLEADIDYTFASGSKIIMFEDNARPEIKISNSSVLRIIGTEMLSCNNLWQGIIVNNGSRLKLLSSNLQDAIYGVDLRDGAEYLIANTDFVECHTGIYCKSIAASQINVDGLAVLNDFDGSGDLIEEFSGASKPVHAIDLLKVTSFSLSGGSIKDYQGIDYSSAPYGAINSSQSGLGVFGTAFDNNDPQDDIYVRSSQANPLGFLNTQSTSHSESHHAIWSYLTNF